MNRVIILRILTPNTAFYNTNPGPLTRGQVVPDEQLYQPPLARGELVRFLGISAYGMYRVRRCGEQEYHNCENGTEGFIPEDSVEIYCLYFTGDINEVRITSSRLIPLTPTEKTALADQIDTLIRYVQIGKSPLELGKEVFEKTLDAIFRYPRHFPVIPVPDKLPDFSDISPVKSVLVVPIDTILYILNTITLTSPCEDFADVVILLKEKDLFYTIINALQPRHLTQYPETCFRLLYMLYFADMARFMKRNLSGSPSVLWSQKQRFLRWPTWDNLSLIDEKSIREMLAKAPEKADYRTLIFFRMKLREIEYLVNLGRSRDIQALWLDLNLVVDAGLQLLFSKDSDNPYLDLIWGLSLNDVWNQVKVEITEPFIQVIGEGDQSWSVEKATGLKALYQDGDMNNGEGLLTDLIPVRPQEKPKEEPVYNDALPVSPCEEEPSVTEEPERSLKSEVREAFKESIVAAAGRVFYFIQSDWTAFVQQQPQFVGEFNRILRQNRSSFYASLSENVKHDFDDRTTASDLDIGGRKKQVADAITWLDMAYIWYYNLGNEKKLGTAQYPLVFRKNAVTTREIIAHPALQRIYKFTRHRIDKGKTGKFRLFVQYTVENFYSSVAANDITFNLLGSYTIEINPLPNGEVNFRLLNTLSLESGSRFRRDENSLSSSSNKKGVIESVERDADPNVFIKIGGSLHCIWNWNENASALPK